MRCALYCSKMISYAQGYMLLREAGKEQGWNLNMGGIALMWRGGCIIRSRFLGKIKDAYDKDPKLTNLLMDDFFSRRAEQISGCLAERTGACHSAGSADAGVLHGAGVFRRLSHGAAAREPAAGSA